MRRIGTSAASLPADGRSEGQEVVAEALSPRGLRRHVGRLHRVLLVTFLTVVVCASSIAMALTVTPATTVTAAGQTVSVGAAAPTLSLTGPGELDLFGQQLPTTIRFTGPVRPRLVLRRITIDSQVASLFTAAHAPGEARSLGRALAAGWKRYFLWEVLVAGGCAVALVAALAGWWRVPWRRALILMAVGLVLVEAVDLGAVMVAAYGAPASLRHVSSLEALVGRATFSVPPSQGAAPPPAQVAVLGDSTAAGLGNPLVAQPTPADRACGRSVDSYARDLAAADGWSVVNLACSGATVGGGLLGPQGVGDQSLPAQVAVAKREKRLSTVIVSIGANDVGWSQMLQACAVVPTCGNSAFAAYFQQQLAAFTTNYLALLQQLATLPGHPLVVVNRYYNPFDAKAHCLAHLGITSKKEKTVSSMLAALNRVLAEGATGPSFVSVRPSFAGHGLCDPQPYVQGVHGAAPFHPTAAGELAIALADQQAVLSHHASGSAGSDQS